MQKLVEVTRGPIVENMHFGSIIVCDCNGKITASIGDNISTYLRSAAKPLQLIPLIEAGAEKTFGFSDQELAIMAGSHYGTKEHAEVISSIMKKISLPQEALQCGNHEPFSRTYTQELRQLGKTPTVLNNNCSGKHAAMLTLCKFNNWETSTYLSPDHPVQRLMLKTVSEMAGINENEVAVGVDGCGVAVFGLQISAMAVAFARLGSHNSLPPKRRQACEKITTVMRTYPFMIAGDGALDTAILSLPKAKLISKIGAEAVFCIAIPDKGLGVAIKIIDGNQKVLAPVVVETLIQLGVLFEEDIYALDKFKRIQIKNFAKKIVGEIRPAFKLSFKA